MTKNGTIPATQISQCYAYGLLISAERFLWQTREGSNPDLRPGSSSTTCNLGQNSDFRDLRGADWTVDPSIRAVSYEPTKCYEILTSQGLGERVSHPQARSIETSDCKMPSPYERSQGHTESHGFQAVGLTEIESYFSRSLP